VKILAPYLSLSRPPIGADLSACFKPLLPVLMAGDLNAKHMDWNSRLSTRWGKLLHDYTEENAYMNFELDTRTTYPYTPSATPNILEIVITKNLTSPVYLTSCSTLSSNHLPVLTLHVAHPSSTHQNALISGALTRLTTKLIWKIKFHSMQNYRTRWQLTRASRNSPAPF
jgi:hypothetical protein